MKSLLCCFIGFGLVFSGTSFATTLSGTYNGTYSCTGINEQGITNVILDFISDGNKFKLIYQIYTSSNSKYNLNNQTRAYIGSFNPKTLTFSYRGGKAVGKTRSYPNYDVFNKGTISADGLSLKIDKSPTDKSCTIVGAKKVTAYSALRK